MLSKLYGFFAPTFYNFIRDNKTLFIEERDAAQYDDETNYTEKREGIIDEQLKHCPDRIQHPFADLRMFYFLSISLEVFYHQIQSHGRINLEYPIKTILISISYLRKKSEKKIWINRKSKRWLASLIQEKN